MAKLTYLQLEKHFDISLLGMLVHTQRTHPSTKNARYSKWNTLYFFVIQSVARSSFVHPIGKMCIYTMHEACFLHMCVWSVWHTHFRFCNKVGVLYIFLAFCIIPYCIVLYLWMLMLDGFTLFLMFMYVYICGIMWQWWDTPLFNHKPLIFHS